MINKFKRAAAALGAAALLAGGAVAVAAPAQAAPRGIGIDMWKACAQQYSAFYGPVHLDSGPYSWRCSIGSSTNPGSIAGGVDLNRYCARNAGTYAYLVINRWDGWRCA